jgi:SRSO17 transposase
MTAEQIAGLGPAFTSYLQAVRHCFQTVNTFGHLAAYCRGLLSDLPRKSVEPIALAAGAAVRTLQEFLTHHRWDHHRMRDELQRRVAREHLPAPGETPADPVGTVGWIDETSVAKKGDKTPGVQRQYCGASGKIDNCIVTVHLACRSGQFMALLDSDLFLPQGLLAWGSGPLSGRPYPRGGGLSLQVEDRLGTDRPGRGQRHPL